MTAAQRRTESGPGDIFAPPLADWYGLVHERKSPYAETIYRRFLERLEVYTEGRLTPELRRQHALRYLAPSMHLLKSPFEFPGMAQAVDLLRAHAANPTAKIVIYGDRDADGVTSASLLTLFCREQLKIGRERLTTLVPREEDKYGITPEVGARIAAEKPALLITLDCGSSNRTELLEIQRQTGTATIIIDHHFIPPDAADYPAVEAFINPKLLPEFEFARDYCTAAITLRFVQAILYSYSREYNENVGIKTGGGEIVIRNGVVDPTADISLCTRHYTLMPAGEESDQHEKHDLAKIFEHTARENFEMRRLHNLYRKAPAAISAPEIFNAVQSVSFRKSQTIFAQYIPFAAIGLVADLMPIYADNRILVREGLSVMTRQADTLPMGLAALIKKLNLTGAVAEQDLGFSVCPVINAAGRMGNAALALHALTETDPLAAAKAVFALTQINEARKEASQASLDLLNEALDARSHNAPVAVAVHANFHRGISGLIASKIAERLAKPALVLVPDGECYRGSVRAFRNENVHGLIDTLAAHLIQYGGHRQAAGFSVSHENITAFVDAVFSAAPELFAAAGAETAQEAVDSFRNFNPPLEIEAASMRMPLWDELLIHAPYGVMNPHPVVAVKKAGKVEVANLGKTGAHVKIKFAAPADRNIEGVWFFHGGAAEGVAGRDNLVVSGEPQIGKFMGRTQYRLKITRVD
ncbi:MAG: DHH family phosphoesterase [Turneriella sp.]|nr:DHH family phosphoesterase [Turneriella sp.]